METYRTLLVCAGWSPTAQTLVKCAVGLANRFGARLRGVSAPALVQTPVAGGAGPGPRRLEVRVAHSMDLLGTRFAELTALAINGASWSWRRTSPAEALALEAHGADLVIVNPSYTWPAKAAAFPGFAPMLRLGRPLLVVPWHWDRLDARVVCLFWNESPQCRRAMADAMPFLMRADRVVLQQFYGPMGADDGYERLLEIEAHLRARGVNASAQCEPLAGRRTARLMLDAAAACGAELIVAGAYGHGRLYRALLGSTTEDLLRTARIAILMSR